MDFVRVFSALLTPAIALLAVYIAFQQYRTHANETRLALFDRRLKVFNSTCELIARVLRNPRNNADNDLSDFLRGTREYKFLFGSDIVEYLDELYTRVTKIQSWQSLPPEDRNQQQWAAEVGWFSGQLDRATDKFGGYLGFTTIFGARSIIPAAMDKTSARKLAREATIFALLDLLIASVSLVSLLASNSGHKAKAYAQIAVHGVDAPDPAEAVEVPLTNGTILHVLGCPQQIAPSLPAENKEHVPADWVEKKMPDGSAGYYPTRTIRAETFLTSTARLRPNSAGIWLLYL